MPYVRRRYNRRPYSRRRTGLRRSKVSRRKYSRFGRRRSTGVYYFKRKSDYVYDWVTQTAINYITAGAGGSDTVANIGFRLQDVPGYTDYAMYDQFRIAAVKLNLIPLGNVSSFTGTTGTIPAGNYAVRTFSAYDPNADGSGVSSVSQVQEYQNCKWSPYNRIHKRYVKPKIMLEDTQVASLGVNLSGKQPWLQNNAGGQGLIHYGIPLACDATGIGIGYKLYKIECTYYMQFKIPK